MQTTSSPAKRGHTHTHCTHTHTLALARALTLACTHTDTDEKTHTHTQTLERTVSLPDPGNRKRDPAPTLAQCVQNPGRAERREIRTAFRIHSWSA